MLFVWRDHNVLFEKQLDLFQGRTLSDFVVSAARDAAIQTIEQTEVIFLSQADQKRFAAELIHPAPLSPAIERAIKKHKELVAV